MRSCADYAWPTYRMTAVIDGVAYEFDDAPLFPEGAPEAGLAAGVLYLAGWSAPEGDGDPCVSCRVLELSLSTNAPGPIVPGTYTGMVTGSEPLLGSVSYRPAYPGTEVTYVSDDGAVDPSEWSGSIEVLSATATRFEATFDFVLWDGRVAPPYPFVTVTDGYVLFTYE